VRDVRMVQRREGLGFACEPDEPFGVARENVGQHFDRNVAIQRRVARPIHLPHAAGAEGRKDFIRTEARAGGKGQSACRGLYGRGGSADGITPVQRRRVYRPGNRHAFVTPLSPAETIPTFVPSIATITGPSPAHVAPSTDTCSAPVLDVSERV
jgi:hypothetical protein